MTAKQDLLGRLWRGRDPFEAFPPKLYAGDLQGWNSDHSYLRRVVDPAVSGRGLAMLRDAGIDGVVLAVDTWLGSWDHWLVAEHFEELGFQNGYPTLFWRFMANVVNTGMQDHVVPLPLDSLNAFQALSRIGVSIDALHIDAGHDYLAVQKDLESWWSLLRPGGVLIADDYFDDENKAWPEVKQAVDDFVAGRGLALEHDRGKAWIAKPI